LGTNDLKNTFGVSPGEIATGASVLAKMILQSDAGLNGKPPQLLLVCPPAIGDMSRAPEIAEKINDAQTRSQALPKRYEAVAAQLGCAYLNSQEIVTPSPIDGIHLEAGEHTKLGKAVAAAVKNIAG
jgi:lysophospholipase L1-like esterase